MISASHRRIFGGLALVTLAACGAPRPQASPVPATAIPVATAAATSGPPWLLLDAAVAPEVRQAVQAWASQTGLEVREADLRQAERQPPGDLWGVVGEEESLASLPAAWSGGSIVRVVVDPVRLASDARTSTLGPEVAEDEAGFLMGAAAGLATGTGLVGVVGAGQGEAWREGFEEGLRYSCPKCRLDTLAEPSQAGFGTDVVAVAPGTAVEAEGTAPWLVVFDDPAFAAAGGRVAARVRKAPEGIVAPALGRLWGGASGEAWAFSVEDGGLVTEVDAQAISPGRERLLREAEQNLAAGWLTVGGGG
ncbi:MAG TPA: hypothetical protein VK449_12855 [Anaerolineales bacterium]|nr:hypothetical protein [Anaerolineales bacterium]